MSWERAQAMASRQLASVGSETTTVMIQLSEGACFYVRTPQTLVVHFEREVGLGFQRGKRLKVEFSARGETKNPSHTVFMGVNLATLGSVKTPTYALNVSDRRMRPGWERMQTLRAFMFLRSIPTSAVTPSPNRKLEAAT